MYIDASGFVKLIADEPESAALEAYTRGRELTSSSVLRTEARRAVRHMGWEAVERIGVALSTVDLVDVTDGILDRAGFLDPNIMRSLDAIHVATALSVADDIAVVVAYDRRMQHAARTVGLRVEAPA